MVALTSRKKIHRKLIPESLMQKARESDLTDRATLIELHNKDRLPIKILAEIAGICLSTMRNRFHRFGIQANGAVHFVNRPRHKTTMALLHDNLLCNKCGWRWLRTEVKALIPCPKCGNCVNARHLVRKGDLISLLNWRRKNEEHVTSNSKKSKHRDFLFAREIVGKGTIKCENCGCTDDRLIEINHKNGGGRKEHKNGSWPFYRDIILGKRSLDDLNLLCSLCNWLDHLNRKFGDIGLSVKWESADARKRA